MQTVRGRENNKEWKKTKLSVQKVRTSIYKRARNAYRTRGKIGGIAVLIAK